MAGFQGLEKRACVSAEKVEVNPWKWLGPGIREVADLAGRQRSGALNLRVLGNWKTSWRTRLRTQILPRRGDGASGMWDQRLVRLALLQHLRAAYGIKVKGGHGQCDRKKRESTAPEIGVSSWERGFELTAEVTPGTITHYSVMLQCVNPL